MTEPAGYTFEHVERFEEPLFTELVQALLLDGVEPVGDDTLTDAERVLRQERRQAFQPPHKVRLAVRHGNDFVGWTCGWQDGDTSFYMAMSAIVPAHRRQGLYTALVRRVVAMARAEGFTEVWSRHRVDNNPVIIAKLKLGFTIRGLDMSPTFGPTVRLVHRLD
jgi:GNAT superfamily N-acetyltransferase